MRKHACLFFLSFFLVTIFLIPHAPARAAENKDKDVAREAVLEDVKLGEQGIVLTLRSIDTVDRIQIVVAEPEGFSILLALRKQKFKRPLTHDLFKNFLDRNGWSAEKILIRDIIDGAFHADVTIAKNGKRQVYDARSSDALALGLRFGAKIFIGEKVLQQERKLEEERQKPSQGKGETQRL